MDQDLMRGGGAVRAGMDEAYVIGPPALVFPEGFDTYRSYKALRACLLTYRHPRLMYFGCGLGGLLPMDTRSDNLGEIQIQCLTMIHDLDSNPKKSIGFVLNPGMLLNLCFPHCRTEPKNVAARRRSKPSSTIRRRRRAAAAISRST